MPPSPNLLIKEEEPPDATQVFLFPVPVLTTLYHDPNAAIILKLHELELLPGYVTSIQQDEEKILLCYEISHKVLCIDTVLNQTRVGPSFHSDAKKALLGAIVVTRYNNKTRLERIEAPRSTTRRDTISVSPM